MENIEELSFGDTIRVFIDEDKIYYGKVWEVKGEIVKMVNGSLNVNIYPLECCRLIAKSEKPCSEWSMTPLEKEALVVEREIEILQYRLKTLRGMS